MRKSKTSNEELIARYQSGDASAMDELLTNNEGMIHAIALKFAKNKDESTLDDAKQEARIALMRAVKGFDLSRGFKFTTYCWRAIVSKLIYWNHENCLIPIKATGRKEGVVVDVISVDSQIVGRCEDGSPWESVTALRDHRTPAQIVAHQDEHNNFMQKVSDRLHRLDLRERKILRERFVNSLILEDIGKEFQIGKERVRQIIETALDKLRQDDLCCKKCRSSHLTKNGHDRYGRQRFICAKCGGSITAPLETPRAIRGFSRTPDGNVDAFLDYLEANPNWTLRKACKASGMTKNTGRRILDHFGIIRRCRTCRREIEGNRFWYCSDACQQWKLIQKNPAPSTESTGAG